MTPDLKECPLGIVGIDGACEVSSCRSREYCVGQTLAWPLPFEYFDGFLYARTIDLLIELRCYWEEAIEEASGAYQEYLDHEASQQEQRLQRWLEEVQREGWRSPDILPYKAIKGGGLVVDVVSSDFFPAVELTERPDDETIKFLPEFEAWNFTEEPAIDRLIPVEATIVAAGEIV